MRRSDLVTTALLLAAAAMPLAGCATVADAVSQGQSASLTGSQEVPGPGDADGSGRAEVTVVDAIDNVCFNIKVTAIAPASAAHLHRGAAGVAGPVVLPFEAPSDGESDGCVKADGALADEIKANPGNFYVNVHNDEFPNGAVRGQLRR